MEPPIDLQYGHNWEVFKHTLRRAGITPG